MTNRRRPRRRSIPEIITAAGGASVIAEASRGAIMQDAVRKWHKIGIPDRHWALVMPMARATPDEMFRANLHVREQVGAA